LLKHFIKDPKHYIDFLRVRFVNRNLGFIIADIINKKPEADYHRYALLRTADAGKSWKVVHKSDEVGFRDVQFITEREGFAISPGGRKLLLTVDAGNTWSIRQAMPEEVGVGTGDFKFVNSQTGWVIISGNDYPLFQLLYHTRDAGRTWVKAKLPVPFH
jgi:photosystem II stability/assembly factor-like uncharacterized protein